MKPNDRVLFDPRNVNISYDIVPFDGASPGADMANEWVQLFQVAAGDPELRQIFDVGRIFQHVAHLMGAKNVEDFVRQGNPVQTQVLPDEQVQEQARQGQLAQIGAL
jgi:hypothetical protein